MKGQLAQYLQGEQGLEYFQPLTNKTIMYKINNKWHKKAKEQMKAILDRIEVEDVDHLNLDLLGDALNIMYTAIDILARDGLIDNSGARPLPSPYVKIKNDAKTEAFKIMQTFGLNPLARKRLKAGTVSDESPLSNLLDELK
jgi:phage terminase small subunit